MFGFTAVNIWSIWAWVKVMVSKGVIRERPRSAEEATEFIRGASFSLLVIVS
jgi:hypothetical protein